MKARIILYTTSLFLCTGSVFAQVTIGSNYEPNKGALLDLKEKEDSDTKQGKANSERGLLLPRVKLTTLSDLSDIPASAGESPASYQGMMVYSVGEGTGLCNPSLVKNGLYVWDGTEWKGLVSELESLGIKEMVDTRDNNKYLYRSFGDAGEWMVENLRFIDGIFHSSQSGDTDNNLQRVFFPQVDGGTEVDPANISTWNTLHGVLYTYSAATYGIRDTETYNFGNNIMTDAVIIGICPDGWHIPNDYEWSRLEEEIAKNPTKYSITTSSMPWKQEYNSSMGDRPNDVENAHGAAMKYMCVLPETGNSTNGTGFAYDKGGFGSLLIGSASAGSAKSYGSTALFMSGSTYDANKIYGRQLYFDKSKVGRIDIDRKELMSVRCKKNVRPSLMYTAVSVPLSNPVFTITTNPLDLKGGTIRWITDKVGEVDNRRGKMLNIRVPGKYIVHYELTTDEGDVLEGVIEVSVIYVVTP